MTQHASPRWIASKVFLEGIPEDKREDLIDALCLAYPTWFYELLVEFEDEPIVLEPFQIRYLLDNSTFKITNKTRQSGGSFQLALNQFHRAYTRKNYRCDIVSINLKEATDKIKYIRAFWETLPKKYQIKLTTDNALSIGFHDGKSKQSIVNSLAASAGIRGGKKSIVFDEFGHIPKVEELFRSALPAIMNGNHTMELVSTPRGLNTLFGEIWHNPQDERGKTKYDNFSRHEFIWVDVGRFVTDYEAAQHVWHNEYNQNMNMMEDLVEEFGNEKIKQIRDMYPWDYFLQEYCGYFIDDANALFTWELIEKCIHNPPMSAEDANGVLHEEVEPLEPWIDGRPEENDNYLTMGVDFGKSGATNDKTSMQILEKTKGGALKLRYSRNLDRKFFPDFPAQAQEIARVAAQFRINKMICDEGGLGLGIVPLIRRMLPTLSIEGHEFNVPLKTELVMNLKMLMEQGNLWLLRDAKQLHAEIHGLQGTPTPSGNIRYHGEPHDDMFWALALAAREGAYKHFAMYTLESLIGSFR